MAKYVNENVAQAIANDIQKNRVLLGAFDIVDTSNANYNLISRNTGFVDLGSLNWVYLTTSGHERWRASFVGFKFINNSTPINAISNNYKIDSSDNIYGHEELNTIGNEDDNFLCCYNGSSTEAPSGILQFELADNLKYTEKVIKGVPILNLDQNGANWLRSEWEKGLNLFNETLFQGGWNYENVPPTKFGSSSRVSCNNLIEVKPNTTYTITNTENKQVAIIEYSNAQASISDSGWQNNAYSFTTSSNTYFITTTFRNSDNSDLTPSNVGNVMLNEGDHAYPYQPYSGAIVHEKEIENVAYKNVDNGFSVKQTISANDTDTPLFINTEKNTEGIYVGFYRGNQSRGWLGINNYKPYFYTANSGIKPSGYLLTEDDIAELKSLVYDNQYPAVKTIKFNTFTALPNSIDGDSLIFGAGSDMTNIDGMSVNYNQLVETHDTQTTISPNDFNNISYVKTPYYQTLWLSFSGNITSGNESDLLLKIVCRDNNGDYAEINLTTSNGKVCGNFDAQNYDTSGMIIRLVNSGSNSITVQNIELKIVGLTQWFNGNDNIPSDLLSNPSLFTSKYWKGSLEYDTGHIESASPKAIVSRGVNIWDEEWVNGYYNANGEYVSNENYVCSKNKCEIKPNTTYYCKTPTNDSNGNTTILFYDKNNNYLGQHSCYGGVSSSKSFTTPDNTYYFNLYVTDYYGTTYNHDICINISNSAINGNYYPYIAPKRYPISVGTDNSVNGVNTIKDIMGVLNTDRAVKEIDFADLQWSTSGSGTWLSTYHTDLPMVFNQTRTNVICSNYEYKKAQDVYDTVGTYYINDSYGDSDQRILVNNGSATDAPTGKLIFPLATPYTEENPQDAILPTNIEIQKGGSLEIESDLPCDITLEVAVSKVY